MALFVDVVVYRGKYVSAKIPTGIKEQAYSTIFAQFSLFLIMSRTVAANATIIRHTEKKRNVKPRVILLGRECLKSSNLNGEVRIERNVTTAAKEDVRDRTSEMVKTTKKG